MVERIGRCIFWSVVFSASAFYAFGHSRNVWADGHVRGPVGYEGSLEERSQEAIIIFRESEEIGRATEDMILKISVAGKTDRFAWVVPFPSEPKVTSADGKLFKELYDYVAFQLRTGKGVVAKKKGLGGGGFGGGEGGVDVLSREPVGVYDVATVRENEPGALNEWLDAEGYEPIENGDDVISEYREKGYVFCCIKVSEAHAAEREEANLHPLRFRFLTGGRDSVYFPMKLTSLQDERFHVNLYVFTRRELNDRHGPFGFERRGFHSTFSDSWETWPVHTEGPGATEPRTAGRPVWSDAEHDLYLRDVAGKIPTVTSLFREAYPGERFILTTVGARYLEPADIRKWPSDLWIFPRLGSRRAIPLDARHGGPARGANATK
ncbi:MAG: DUF2330 domain-containing protein [Pirellulales bacterium]